MTCHAVVAWQAPAEAWPAADGIGIGYVQGMLALLVVFGLLAAFVWLVRRGQLGALGVRRPGGIVVETAVALGERRTLAIVSVEGRRLLLGLTPVQVSFVTELAPQAPATAFATSLDRAASTEPS